MRTSHCGTIARATKYSSRYVPGNLTVGVTRRSCSPQRQCERGKATLWWQCCAPAALCGSMSTGGSRARAEASVQRKAVSHQPLPACIAQPILWEGGCVQTRARRCRLVAGCSECDFTRPVTLRLTPTGESHSRIKPAQQHAESRSCSEIPRFPCDSATCEHGMLPSSQSGERAFSAAL